jgi:RNA polymerase sigma factor (TIGR02999 family)
MSLPKEPISDLTTLLHAWRDGSDAAFGQLIDRVYDQLVVIAAKRLSQSGNESPLSPSDLLHDALIGIMPTKMEFQNRVHFFATMSVSMRAILVDHARARAAGKRGGRQIHVTFTEEVFGEASVAVEMLAIEQALSRLEALDPRCGQVLHLTYFAGLSQEEIASILNISLSTVTRDLRFAHSWISKALRDDA